MKSNGISKGIVNYISRYNAEKLFRLIRCELEYTY